MKIGKALNEESGSNECRAKSIIERRFCAEHWLSWKRDLLGKVTV